jgi:hypothetical protein
MDELVAEVPSGHSVTPAQETKLTEVGTVQVCRINTEPQVPVVRSWRRNTTQGKARHMEASTPADLRQQGKYVCTITQCSKFVLHSE